MIYDNANEAIKEVFESRSLAFLMEYLNRTNKWFTTKKPRFEIFKKPKMALCGVRYGRLKCPFK